jgi:glycosyltransferase involved in cell wall biosynthesis
LRVAFWLGTGEIPGGHQVQAHQTIAGLRKLGVDAYLAESPQDLANSELVHSFGAGVEVIRQARLARRPVVSSPVYCSMRWEYQLDGSLSLSQEARRRARAALHLAKAAIRARHIELADRLLQRVTTLRVAFESADLLLPNSEGEAADITRELGVTTPMRIVPNGVDPQFAEVTTEAREGVLCVGRIEPHKNQLTLIQQVHALGLPLTIIGPEHPHHTKYAQKCRAASDSSVRFLAAMPQAELKGFFAAAKVHVLPSWYETTGLVSLEAAAAGCSVVTTSRGHAAEYFGDLAWYCDPEQPDTIQRAIREAYQKAPDAALRAVVLERFTWRNTAEATLAAYQEVL